MYILDMGKSKQRGNSLPTDPFLRTQLKRLAVLEKTVRREDKLLEKLREQSMEKRALEEHCVELRDALYELKRKYQADAELLEKNPTLKSAWQKYQTLKALFETE